MARPKIEIDRAQFEKLCSLQCTAQEIAGFFDCSVDTIERWCNRTYQCGFADVFTKKRMSGIISLRRTQFKLAEKNTSMAIWLGKQYLGQKEQQEIKVSAIDESVKEIEEYFKARASSEPTMG